MVDIILFVVLAFLGFLAGLKYRSLTDKIKNLEEKVDEEEDNETPFVDVSPKAVAKRIHDSTRDDEESAVIKIKSPEQLRREKEAEANQLLDNFSGK